MVSNRLRQAFAAGAVWATREGGPSEGESEGEFLEASLLDLENDSELAEFFNIVVDSAWEAGYDDGYDSGFDSGLSFDDFSLVDEDDED